MHVDLCGRRRQSSGSYHAHVSDIEISAKAKGAPIVFAFDGDGEAGAGDAGDTHCPQFNIHMRML
jgi:hypothetical protein